MPRQGLKVDQLSLGEITVSCKQGNLTNSLLNWIRLSVKGGQVSYVVDRGFGNSPGLFKSNLPFEAILSIM